MRGDASLYAGQRVALLTKHGKERVIAPVLEPAIGCRLQRVAGYDTDLLGTFTREIPRAGTQIEAARKKARIGMELSGLTLGLASEGSFGPDPMAGMFLWNVEFLIWIDDRLDLEIVGVAQGKTNSAHVLAATWEDVEAFARQAGFPEHYLTVRPQDEHDSRLSKDIAEWEELREVFRRACAQAANGHAFIETDLRAHANPTRRENIRWAAEDLLKKLGSLCPACGAPGFWHVERIAGLPCGDCGAPTRETRAEVHGCLKCAHRETRKRTDRQHADPGRCDYCNP
jgi:hypothetical protein